MLSNRILLTTLIMICKVEYTKQQVFSWLIQQDHVRLRHCYDKHCFGEFFLHSSSVFQQSNAEANGPPSHPKSHGSNYQPLLSQAVPAWLSPLINNFCPYLNTTEHEYECCQIKHYSMDFSYPLRGLHKHLAKFERLIFH